MLSKIVSFYLDPFYEGPLERMDADTFLRLESWTFSKSTPVYR